MDRLRGYEMGAVDYVPVPVVPEVLCAKVKIFAEVYRKSRQLEQLNAELERRVADRTAALERSNRQLQQSEERRNLALVAGKMGSWDWDLLGGDCVWDEGQRRIFGVGADFEATLPELRKLVHRDDWSMLYRALQHARRDAGSRQIEFRVCRPDGGVGWCFGTVAASVDAHNRIARISGVTIDITDRKEAEQRQLLLAREVDHRAKNALAVVHAILSLTRAENIAQFVAAVEGRVQALARAHSLLSESRWRGANISDIIEEELAPYRAPHFDRITIAGTSLSLDPSTAQALALALHELATNAAKYGALSRPSGRLQVSWTITNSRLELRWIERGGPPPQSVEPGGFGIRVIKAGVEGQLDGNVEFDWRQEGLRCSLSVPLREKPDVLQKQDGPAERPNANGDGSFDIGPRRRVLLVEDETLIAMMMEGLLRDLDIEVVGPFGTIDDALEAVRHEAIDAALLDVNLGGEMAYPIARLLQAKKVPFVFMTGYGSETIAAPFSNIRVVQKPLERELLRDLFASPPKPRQRADMAPAAAP
ncbi:MAG: response regulator [Xanthobacteraceae bacterium]|nr:response regulator [Xanthobacteraceae bacterium]